jgi:hypothetical protein
MKRRCWGWRIRRRGRGRGRWRTGRWRGRRRALTVALAGNMGGFQSSPVLFHVQLLG